jgi:D-alanine-D-alanine ligase
MKRVRIAVLAGGWSSEREVSLRSGEAVFNALDKNRYDVIMYDPRDDLESLFRAKNEIDLAFILLHGRFGEDGRIQGLLDIFGIPFAGSGVISSAMALNKRISKDLFYRAGLKVANDIILRKGEAYSVSAIEREVGQKVVIKPVSEGSSMGISICGGAEEINKGISVAFRYDSEVMVEEYIEGREITCGVLGFNPLETLPLIEILPNTEYRFFDYEAKYKTGATNEICPAVIPEKAAENIRDYAKKAHIALGCSLWSRTDMILKDETVYVLETNTIPGMTDNSLFPLAAAEAGMPMAVLIDKMIQLSLSQIGEIN